MKVYNPYGDVMMSDTRVPLINAKCAEGTLSGYVKNMQEMILRELKSVPSPNDNLSVKNLENLCFGEGAIPGIGDSLLSNYKKRLEKLGIIRQTDGIIGDIRKQIRVNQQALCESMMFGYNLRTCEMNLYTLNPWILKILGVGVGYEKMMETSFERNLSGYLHAYRIDIKYETSGNLMIKAVSLQRKKWLGYWDFMFFPYEYVRSCMVVLYSLMNKGYVFRIRQDLGDVIKERYMTTSKDVLKRYCDCPEAVDGLGAFIMPWCGYMYVPVVGAPAVTAMVSRVDIFLVSRVDIITSVKDIKVERVENSVRSEVIHNVIMKSLEELSVSSEWDYMEVISSLPKSESFFKDEQSKSLVDTFKLSKYLHTLGEADLLRLVDMIPGCPETYEKYMKLFGNCHSEMVDVSGMSDSEFRKLLHTGIFRIISISSGVKFNSMTVTNSSRILSVLYGKDYLGKYESWNVRVTYLGNMIRKLDSDDSIGLKSSLEYCGFSSGEEWVGIVREFYNYVKVYGMSEDALYDLESALRALDGEETGVEKYPKAYAGTGSILVRNCFAVWDSESGGYRDFYRYVKPTGLVRVIRLA